MPRYALFDADGRFTGRSFVGPIESRPAAQSGEYWNAVQAPPEYIEPVPSIDTQWRVVRAERNARLAACDWVVTRAADRGEPVPQVWRDYRQALRDVTEQPDPRAIAWPSRPDGA